MHFLRHLKNGMPSGVRRQCFFGANLMGSSPGMADSSLGFGFSESGKAGHPADPGQASSRDSARRAGSYRRKRRSKATSCKMLFRQPCIVRLARASVIDTGVFFQFRWPSGRPRSWCRDSFSSFPGNWSFNSEIDLELARNATALQKSYGFGGGRVLPAGVPIPL